MEISMIGIDVGGTTIKGIRLSPQGEIESEVRVLTPSPDPSGEFLVDAVALVVDRLGGVSDAPIGLVVPGIVDETRGYAVWSANVGYRNVPVRELISARLGVPVAFGQDVRAGALAELRLSAGRTEHAEPSTSMAFVAIGTGVAAAFVVDGRSVVSDGWAGEIGQLVFSSGPHAGRRMEEIASASATARRAGESDALAVARRVEAGDPAAREVWQESIDVLADSLAGIVVSLAPRAIVLGGGLAQSGDLLLAPLRLALQARIGGLREPSLTASVHNDLAAALGACLLARDLHARNRRDSDPRTGDLHDRDLRDRLAAAS
jgi:glucokinase